jgi:hypothetical protein
MKAPMAPVRSLTERKAPRRMAGRVMMPRKISCSARSSWPGDVQGDRLVLWPGEPRADLGVLVGAVVVEHDVQVSAGAKGGHLLREPQEFLVAVPRVAGIRGDLAGSDLKGGKQRGGTAALVVVGAPDGEPGPERQHRGGPVQRLDLLFSSTLTTTALSGGARYSPMTSRTFA